MRKRYEQHGLSYTRIYKIWETMVRRCSKKARPKEREWYRDKGIRVCLEWRISFKSFYQWSISHGYSEKLVLDRIRGEEGYKPTNCRWATHSQNSANRPKWMKSRSKYKGVCWNKQRGKWMVIITVERKLKYGGVFTSEIKAAQRYDELARQYFGQYAFLNFPDNVVLDAKDPGSASAREIRYLRKEFLE